MTLLRTSRLVTTQPAPCCPYCRVPWHRMEAMGGGAATAVIKHFDWCPVAGGEVDGRALIPDPATFARLRIRP